VKARNQFSLKGRAMANETSLPTGQKPPVMPQPVRLAAPSDLDQVTDTQLACFADLIYGRTGIRVSPQKKALLSNRLRRRLRETRIASFGEYYQHLLQLRPNDPEWDALIQEITTHETYFFRDESQWTWFRKTYLASCAGGTPPNGTKETLRIWSAACSTGDEPYTIACSLAASLANWRRWKIRVLGTDIGAGSIEECRRATFSERSMRLVPADFKKLYFSRLPGAPQWVAKPMLTELVRFRQHNLLTRLDEPPFDIVFLKNVLIYFDAASKKRVMENVRAAVRPGGYLVTGAAEGVAEHLREFKCLQSWLHQRPS
jgi:chemotaxis protein methyltransferase CheR